MSSLEEYVRAKAVKAALAPSAAARGVPLIFFGQFLKGTCKGNPAIRAWLSARPQDYLVLGQYVLVLAALEKVSGHPRARQAAIQIWIL